MSLPQSPVSGLTLSSAGSQFARTGVITGLPSSYSDPFTITAPFLRLAQIKSFNISGVYGGYVFSPTIAEDGSSVSISIYQSGGSGIEEEQNLSSPATALLTQSVSGTVKTPYNMIGLTQLQYTPAYLTGSSSATSVVATWNTVTAGSFSITIDGTVRNVTGLNFSTASTMADVAGIIQNGIRSLTNGQETVVWSTNHFILSSADTNSTSAITVTSAEGSGTDISGAGGTNFMYANATHGTVTAKSGPTVVTATVTSYTPGSGMIPTIFEVTSISGGAFDDTTTVIGTNQDMTTFSFTPAVPLMDLWTLSPAAAAILEVQTNDGTILTPAFQAPATHEYFIISTTLIGTLDSDGWNQLNLNFLPVGGAAALSIIPNGTNVSTLNPEFSSTGL